MMWHCAGPTNWGWYHNGENSPGDCSNWFKGPLLKNGDLVKTSLEKDGECYAVVIKVNGDEVKRVGQVYFKDVCFIHHLCGDCQTSLVE